MERMSSAAANPIAVVELLAVLVAVSVWRDRVHGRAVLAFVDNEPAKHALIRGGSSVADVASVVGDICAAEIQEQALIFFERVPTGSNVADPPSRGEVPPRLPGWMAPQRQPLAKLGGRGAQGPHPFLEGMRDSSL